MALKNIVEINKGKQHTSVFSTNGSGKKRYIQIGDLRNDFNLKYTDQIGVEVFPNDLIIAWDGANAGTIGFNLSGYIGSTLARLRIKKNDFDAKFLGWYLRSKSKDLRQNCTGATIPHISKSYLESIQIPKIDLPTQKQIAQFLEEAAIARQKRKAANALTDKFLQSTFLSIFGDPVENEKGFKLERLENLYAQHKDGTKCGPFGSALKRHEYVENGIPVWVMDNIIDGRFIEEGCLFITNEKFEQLKSYSVEKGDIIISRAGTVGKMCEVKTDYSHSIISTNLIRLSLNKNELLPVIFVSLMTYFGSRVGKLRTGTDGAFTHMNTGVLNNLQFPLPPINLQKKFASIVADTEQLRQKQKQSEIELENLFQTLLQKYFG